MVTDLLPSYAVLRKLYDENRIQLAPKELVEFVGVVRKIVTTQPLDKIKLENTVMKLASGKVGDVTSIGVMLVRHSKAGAPLGIRLLEVATKKGDMDAEHQYAQLLCQDIAGPEKNVKKALNHMRRLAEKNHARSQYIMGLRYIFTASDIKGGLAFLESAAAAGIAEAACQLGHSGAQHNLGVLYLDGDRAAGIPRDIHRAIEYWKMAAAQGTEHSKLNLAQIYAAGIRIPGKLFARIEANPDLAKQYLTDVVKAGGPLAAVAEKILKKVMIESVGDQQAKNEAAKEKANGTGCTIM
ncbi:hypothetical protein HDU85_003382 [Gaertneriomyces sp. JEL0708]|nr:hypothetical protein HDU85_003382 [Gaertneriomyces sp. JEL0708]